MMTQEKTSGSFQRFVNDDEGYLAWIEANPNGYVVNSYRQPSPVYLKLHKAKCKFMSSEKWSNWTTTGYIKICSNSLEAVEKWAREEVGGVLDPCGICKPATKSEDSAPIRPSATPKAKITATLPAAPKKLSPAPRRSTAKRSIPDSISTGCPELDLVWQRYAADILDRPHVLIPDTEDDLSWHAFLGHSIDMQGFRAAEFVGVDPLTKNAPAYVSLQDRGIGVKELASLWEIEGILCLPSSQNGCSRRAAEIEGRKIFPRRFSTPKLLRN